MQEVWKPVSGYEGKYEVSNIGRVKSLGRTYSGVSNGKPVVKPLRERILQPILLPIGYFSVALCRDGIRRTTYIHRLVASAFIPNPDALSDVNHLDSCRTNNLWTNLEWTTRGGNVHHCHAKGRMAKGAQLPQTKLTARQVLRIRAAVADGATHQSLATHYGVTVSNVGAIIRRKSWKHI